MKLQQGQHVNKGNAGAVRDIFSTMASDKEAQVYFHIQIPGKLGAGQANPGSSTNTLQDTCKDLHFTYRIEAKKRLIKSAGKPNEEKIKNLTANRCDVSFVF